MIGALPDEAVSWGKIRMDAKPVKVFEWFLWLATNNLCVDIW